MNDFTKEEIGILGTNLCINPRTKELLKKIVYMYENYCEHEKAGIEHIKFMEVCKKCKEPY
jgi:hypothetical protein